MKFPAFEAINLKNDLGNDSVLDLDISKIEPDLTQPRKMFDKNALEELASSIKVHGIIQPILVRVSPNNINRYQIVAGERRWRASKLIGLSTIPAIVKDYDKKSKLAISLIENIQRQNLNPLEEAQAIQSLLDECDLTHHQVAESIGKSRVTVTNLLRLLNLAPKVKDLINANQIEMGHARALLSLTMEQQIEAAKLIITKSLSVRATENLVKKLLTIHSTKQDDVIFDAKLEEWSKKLRRNHIYKAEIKLLRSGKGRLLIKFDSVVEADALIDLLCSEKETEF